MEDNVPEVFGNADCLINSHVTLAMERILAMDDKVPDSFHGVLEYVRQVSKFKQEAAVQEVLDRLGEYDDLSPFQKAALVNLLPENPEEAKTLIPSLQEFDHSRLQDLLTSLKNIQNFAGVN